MSRIGFADESADPELTERIRAGRGFVPNIFRVLLISPPLAEGWARLAGAFRGPSELDDRSRELAILLVAHLKDSAYEWGHHARVAERVGVTPREIEALRAWPERGGWSEADWALLALVASTTLHIPVPESCVAVLVRDGGRRRVVELAGLAAYYTAVSHFSAVLALEPDDPPVT